MRIISRNRNLPRLGFIVVFILSFHCFYTAVLSANLNLKNENSINLNIPKAQIKDTIECIYYPYNLRPPGNITSITGDKIWAIFPDQQIYRWDGRNFQNVSKFNEDYDVLFAVSSGELWVHFYCKNRYRYFFRKIIGNNIIEYSDPDNFPLRDIFINSPDDIWACGIVGNILHFDGKQWSKHPGVTNNHIERIVIYSPQKAVLRIDDLRGMRKKYRINLQNGKKLPAGNYDHKNISTYDNILGVFSNGVWVRKSDRIIFLSDNNEQVSYQAKSTKRGYIPVKKGIIFNKEKSDFLWGGFNLKGGEKFKLLFCSGNIALRLYDHGKIDSVVVVVSVKSQSRQFMLLYKSGLQEYSAGCGFLNRDYLLDIVAVNPTGKNRILIHIGKENNIAFIEETSNYNLVENQQTSEKKVFYDNGILITDMNNDNHQDVLITAHQGSTIFFKNIAGKKFKDITKFANLFNEDHRSNMAIAGDVDNDGDLDLFITREFTTNVLYLNNGFGKFKEGTKEANLISERGGMGCAFGDIDADGDLDLFVANWRIRNRLYRNEGIKKTTGMPFFIDITDSAGIKNDNVKRSNAALLGDVDNDGDLDLFVINRTDANRLYLNNGKGEFRDITKQAGLFEKNGIHSGGVFFDVDNDGDLDLTVACKNRNLFYRNMGGAVFSEESKNCGFMQQGDTNTIIAGDFDLDGDIDLYATSSDMPSQIYRNQQNDKRFVKIQLTGYLSNRDAVGAKVCFYEGGHLGEEDHFLGLRTIDAGSGLASTNSKIVHFGTGEYKKIDFEVKFPSGKSIIKTGILPGSSLELEEIQGRDKYLLIVKWQFAAIYHAEHFFLEFMIYVLFLLCVMFILPNLFNLKIKNHLLLVIIPVGTLILSRFILNNNPLYIELDIPILFGFLSFVIVVQNVKKKLRKQEIEEITDQLWQELVQFHHGDWARSNINQLLFFAQNIDENNQAEKKMRNKLLAKINAYIQMTFPSIRRIVQLGKYSDELKTVIEKIEKESMTIYVSLEGIKNAIQLNEPLAKSDFGEIITSIMKLKLDLDKVSLQTEKRYRCNLKDVLKNIKETQDYANKIAIDWQFDTIEDVFVRIKQTDLFPIVDNLIQNAMKATAEDEHPQLSILGKRKDERFLLHFVDNGSGVMPDQREVIFEEGYTTAREKGKGKGLAFSKKILKKYGGDIYVDHSEVGQEVDFVLEFAIVC